MVKNRKSLADIVYDVIDVEPGKTTKELQAIVLREVERNGYKRGYNLSGNMLSMRIAQICRDLMSQGLVNRIEESSEFGYKVTWWLA